MGRGNSREGGGQRGRGGLKFHLPRAPRAAPTRGWRGGQIADRVNATLMVDMAHFSGLVAGGAYPSPFPHAHVVTSTTHKVLRGPRGGIILTDDEELAKKINSAVFPGLQGGPLMHAIAAKAVAFREALRPSFRAYAEAVGGQLPRARAHTRGGRAVGRVRRDLEPPPPPPPSRTNWTRLVPLPVLTGHVSSLQAGRTRTSSSWT